MPPIGLYIHVPFCLKKCPYCDFFSLPYTAALADAYTDAVCNAIRSYGGVAHTADSLYLGGGTPSLLGGERLARICAAAKGRFSLAGAEITLEANPESITLSTLRQAHAAGFNRLSLGLQSALPAQLCTLGRSHTPAHAENAVAMARQAGFTNISLDLMLGVPGQTPASLKQSVAFCAAQGVEHLSAYLLKIEEDTPFHKDGVAAQDDDAQSALYLLTVEEMEKHGFAQYEISNFAKPGYESFHNLKYWLCKEYLGVGPSAHSFIGGRRFYFERDLHTFLKAPDAWALPIDDGEGGGFEEYAMLRLRLTQGLHLTEAAALYPGEDYTALLSRAKALVPHGLCKAGENIVSLTPQGFLLSNTVICRILGL